MPIRTVQERIPQYQGELPAYEFKGMATGGLPLGGSEQPAGDARPFQHLGVLKTLFTADLLKRVRALRHTPWVPPYVDRFRTRKGNVPGATEGVG
jgi:hypothetical protein